MLISLHVALTVACEGSNDKKVISSNTESLVLSIPMILFVKNNKFWSPHFPRTNFYWSSL